jgi:small-conductance mechanosensitive channel
VRAGSRARRRNPRQRRATGGANARQRAQGSLRRFRQASLVAIAITGLLLLIFAPEEAGSAQEGPTALPDTVAIIQQVPLEDLRAEAVEAAGPTDPTAEATGALWDLWEGFVENLPKYVVALGVLVLAWMLVRLIRAVLRRVLRGWERREAMAAMAGVVTWLLAAGVALSVLLGDIRALAGSLGLVGLALSWALQTPIESFTGWLLNSFKGYYRVGDRISVGEVFGDVFRIDFLTTTVWEYGGRDNPPGWIDAEQPTGRLITFPNNEILTGPVVNYTRDFPYVWDELTTAVANESDIPYAMEVLRRVGDEVVGEHMREPARRYREILVREGLDTSGVWEEPRVFASLTDWGANLTIRYLVAARQRRVWKSQLALRVVVTLNHDDHGGRILPIYPRQQIQVVRPDGAPAEVQWFSGEGGPWGEARPHQNRGREA